MPVFQYIAVDEKGREVSGRTEAADEPAAVAALRARSWLVMDIRSVRRTAKPVDGVRMKRKRRGRVRERERIQFFRQLALMIRSGLTLLQSLQISARQTPRTRLANCLTRLAEAIQGGRSLSASMAAEPRQFSPLVVKLVESAEVTGELDAVLEEIAELLERRMRIKAALLTSLLYPTIIIMVSVTVAVFLVLKVIPKFAAFFIKRNIALPATTKALVDLSAFVQAYGIYLLIAMGLAGAALMVVYTRPGGKRWIHGMILRLPVFGGLLTVAAMTRLTQTLASLVRSGVILLESLRITARVMGNRALAARIRETGERILQGESLETGLSGPPVPDLVPQVVGVGERSGTLTEALDDLGRFYAEELQAGIRRMSAAVEPAMILIVGGMVGFVYIAFFQAVFRLAKG